MTKENVKIREDKEDDDKNIDLALRPKTWQEYVGQEKVKRNLKILIEAAKKRSESCDHLLLYGAAGLGKTTLAHLVAKEMEADIKVTSGPALEKTGDLASVLSNLEPGDVLFIDEAHRLNKVVEEILYPALESRRLHIIIGKGPGARTLSLELTPFTLIAATTRIGLISNPLRSRFGVIARLDYYKLNDIEAIIKRSSQILRCQIEPEAIKIIAAASRFTPRIANRLLKRSRDYAQVYGQGIISKEISQKTLSSLEIDNLGLEPHDRRLLQVLIKKFNGGPVGLSTLAASLNEEKDTLEEVYEPYLMNLGFLQRTSQGRIATAAAYDYLKIPKNQKNLF